MAIRLQKGRKSDEKEYNIRFVRLFFLFFVSVELLFRSLTGPLANYKFDLTAYDGSRTAMDRKLECWKHRGNNGKWTQDFDVANQTHYRIESTYTTWHFPEKRFTPTTDQPFRWATTWKWEDAECPVTVTSKESFCDLSRNLDLRRLLVLGDSLSIQFAISFISLLGMPPDPRQGSFNGLFRRPFVIHCAEVDEERPAFDFSMYIWRRSPITDLEALCKSAISNTTSTADQHIRNFVLSDSYRTAIIANTGSWIHGGLEEFQRGFHCIIDWMDSLQSGSETGKVLGFYRPVLHGNFDCQPSGINETETAFTFNWTGNIVRQTPHKSYQEFAEVTESILKLPIADIDNNGHKYSRTSNGVNFDKNWAYFESYNEYAKKHLDERLALQLPEVRSWTNLKPSNGVPIWWVNVYNSSILRRDGHVGFGDCLHYSLPGPTDWWVHFFFSLLLDLKDLATGSSR